VSVTYVTRLISWMDIKGLPVSCL